MSKGAKGKGGKAAEIPEMVKIASNQAAQMSAKGKVTHGMEAIARLEADLEGNPILFVGLVSDSEDDFLAQADIPAAQALEIFIGKNVIPGGTARPEHKDYLRKSLSNWKDEIEKALRIVEDLPEWGEPASPKGTASGKAKPKR